MKTIKRIVIAWFVMSAIFDGTGLLIFAYTHNTIGITISSILLWMLLSVMVLCIRVLLSIEIIVESEKLKKP